MKRPEELSHMLTEMYNDTKDGKNSLEHQCADNGK